MLFIGGTAGCNSTLQSLLHKTQTPEQPLIKVHIQFSDQKEATCYVKTLGMEKGAPLYTGGTSSNNMYDRDGNIVGSFNYQHVVYMNVLPDEGSTD
jgi:hypothetical protein